MGAAQRPPCRVMRSRGEYETIVNEPFEKEAAVEDVPPGLIVESDALTSAPLWRREPYILFFPAGVALSWAGVLHWLLHAYRLLPEYRPIFHAMTQVQGFMTCLAVGFLFTMIPRRTGSAPPAGWQISVGLLAPLVTMVAAWNQRWIVAQVAWLLLAATLIGFAVSRFLGSESTRRPPNAFVWIPLAFLMGISGAVISLTYGRLEPQWSWLHTMGSGLVLQGLFIGLVLGVGSLALPLMTRDQAPPDAGMTAGDWRARGAHLTGAVLLISSFAIEALYSLRIGMALRGTVILAVLVFSTEHWRLPERPGYNARVIWLAAWMVPLGYFVAALFPEQSRAGLHVTFIGGFALLGLIVSTQVVLGHGGHIDLLRGRPWQVFMIATLLLAAIIPRAAMEFDPRRYFTWMALAALLFLAATTIWMMFVIPKLIARARGV